VLPGCAFDVALQVTYQQTAKQNQPVLVNQLPPSPPMPRAEMPLSDPMANGSVSAGPRIAHAHSVTNAETTTAAVYVEDCHMVLPNAKLATDPRSVFTPIDPNKAEILVRTLNLHNKWKHVITGLREGFDVGIRQTPNHTIIFDNHYSSQLNPEFISSYVASEHAVGRYSEPFQPSDLENIIGPFRTSPIGLVPKPNSSKFRMIQDLSYPRNNPSIDSINTGINSDEFSTGWGTFDTTSKLILSLPNGCKAATFDISAAYRITPVRPDQQNALCIFWKGMVRVDRAVMFGLASSAGVFGCVTDMLVDIYTTSGFGPLVKWVDDFFVIRLPHDSWTEKEFMDLTASIGVPWSIEKLRPLSSIQRYIGFDWHLDSKAVSIPTEKIKHIQDLLQGWLIPNI